MMKDDSVYVSKNVSFKNNLAIEMKKNEANNQLKAYCQANKILSDQIRELFYCFNSFTNKHSYSNKSIHAKLNALEKQIVDWNGMGPQNE